MNRIYGILFLLVIIYSQSIFGYSDNCQDWFLALRIKKDKNCIVKCSSSKVDMSNFECPMECEDLCKNRQTNLDYDLLKLYGLTDDEIQLCNKNQVKCIQGYLLSIKAESLCLDIYPSSQTNDESDACRHYVWSILLSRDLDPEFAENLLNAHENNPLEPENEKAMDLSNNRLGLLDFSKIESPKTNDKIIKKFKRRLKDKSIVVLKPKYKQNGGLP